ncbi:response regulator [Desulfobulbus rhabdoformis]|uniref:chemotaxis protein CheB n=1 Tax=Desulfobulbus rhabdoformis TaxID=34032 RepID=UPI0019664857|nr:chemotaxis protein CheB [Desulfobulbus rhabdoformis]MBM9614097.1 response regulator [Desulfobulbus rhabdoformis]
MEEKIKVLVVDDAGVMRRAVVDILNSDPMIEVIDTAENGLVGLEKAQRLQPDVITLDMDMPVMNGISAIRHIMIKCQIPIVVLSSLFADGAITFEALRLGVVDFVPKPSGAVSRDLNKGKEMIIDRVKLAAAVKVGNIHRAKLPSLSENKPENSSRETLPPEALVIIGTNLCGPNTVIRMIATLPPILRAGIVVIQDISLKILATFAEQFDKSVPWKIHALQEDTIIEPGRCYIGSTETSLSFTTSTEGKPLVLVGGPVDRPIDLLYSSAAATFQGPIVGVLLGGIGDDGAEGLGMIQRHQGTTLVQDTHYCVFPNLTENAIRCGVADKIVKDRDLAAAVQQTLES